MQYPTLGEKSSSKKLLLEETRDVIAILKNARWTMERAMPRVRDYPTRGDYNEAITEHNKRDKKLHALILEYAALESHLDGKQKEENK